MWNIGGVTITGQRMYWVKNLRQCHCVHHISHMDWPGIEPESPRWEAGGPILTVGSVSLVVHTRNVFSFGVALCTTSFNIREFSVLPTRICVLYGAQNKEWLFPYVSLTDWFLYQIFNPIKPSGYYMYRTVVTMYRTVVTICTTSFNIQQLYVLPTQLYLCVLCGSQNKQRLFPYTALTDWFV